MARFASISSLEQADLWRLHDTTPEAKGLEQRANEMPLKRPLDKRYDMVNYYTQNGPFRINLSTRL